MNKPKWWRVAAHEYGFHVRRKGFLFSTIGIPLLFIVGFGLIFVFFVFTQKPASIGFVDQSPLTAAQPDRLVITDTLTPDITLMRYPDEAAARAATTADTIQGYVVIPADYIATGQLRAYAKDDLSDASKDAIATMLERSLIANTATVDTTRLDRPITEVRQRTLASDREVTRGQGILLFFAPYLFSMFFFIAVFTSSSYLMTALVEEKENRVIEILATSMRPLELMAGKIVGLGLLGLTQIVVWTASIVGMFLIARSQITAFQALSLPWGVVAVAALMFVPAYLLVAATLSTIGAAVTAVQEGQQMSGFVSLLLISPVFFLTVIISHPNAPLAVLTSLVPFTAPLVMMQRIALTTVPLWQLALSVLLQALAAVAMIWVAGRVLRAGMLRYGKRLSLRDIGRAVRN